MNSYRRQPIHQFGWTIVFSGSLKGACLPYPTYPPIRTQFLLQGLSQHAEIVAWIHLAEFGKERKTWALPIQSILVSDCTTCDSFLVDRNNLLSRHQPFSDYFMYRSALLSLSSQGCSRDKLVLRWVSTLTRTLPADLIRWLNQTRVRIVCFCRQHRIEFSWFLFQVKNGIGSTLVCRSCFIPSVPWVGE